MRGGINPKWAGAQVLEEDLGNCWLLYFQYIINLPEPLFREVQQRLQLTPKIHSPFFLSHTLLWSKDYISQPPLQLD